MKTKAQQYWRQNLIYLFSLLVIWFIVSYGAGILFVDWLDQFKLAGLNWVSGSPSRDLFMYL
ncbi:MAG: sodium/substrate symporter small subunit [Balneolaceae bacterium]